MAPVKETSRRRITVTSSLNEFSMDQLRYRVGVKWEASGQICKDDVNGFFFSLNIFFPPPPPKSTSPWIGEGVFKDLFHT